MKQQAQNKDPARVMYLDIDVLTAAKERFNRLYDEYDNVWIAYSGGKDSQVCVTLAEMILKERGQDEKPKVFFRDEEIIPDIVIDDVRKKAESGDYEFRYFANEMQNRKFLMGKQENYVAWDKQRKWLRDPPPYAIQELTDRKGNVVPTRDLTQTQLDDVFWGKEKGKTVVVTGVRADESVMRFMGLCQKEGTENWLGTNSKIHQAKPVFDWTELDIFKFFYEEEVPYCKIYDDQMWSGMALRVSTPLHEMTSHQLPKLKSMYPTFYHQIVQLFPDVEAHARYWTDYDKKGLLKRYPPTFDGIRAYIDDHLGDDEEVHRRNHAYVDGCEKARKAKIEAQGHDKNLGGYPVYYVFNQVISGGWGKNGVKPMLDKNVSLEMKEYERQ